jgi:acetyltransferase
LLADDANDAVLGSERGHGLASAADAARAVVETVRRDRQGGYRKKPVFAVWLGQDGAATELRGGRHPELRHGGRGGEGFMHLVRYRDAQDA